MNRDSAQGAKPIKLQIMVSDRCNLRCGHCLVSAGPHANRWILSDRDIDQIAAVVDATPQVLTVHFTGGEPTLFRDLIARLQKRITRNVRYGMTTNGTLGEGLTEFLGTVALSEITLSYDRFRETQVKKDTLLAFVKAATTRGIPVTVNCVFDSLSDLGAPQFLVQAGATLATAKLVRAGRAETLPKNGGCLRKQDTLSGTCPSLIDPEARAEAYETVIFFPGEGFTNCCGPLVFANTVDRDRLFARDLATLATSPLRQFLDRTSFADALHTRKLTSKSPCTRCEACVLLFGQKDRRLAC